MFHFKGIEKFGKRVKSIKVKAFSIIEKIFDFIEVFLKPFSWLINLLGVR